MLKSNRDQISSMTHADRMNAFAVFALLLNFLSISSCFAQNDIVLHEIIKHSLSSKKELCSTHAKYNLNFKIEDASSQPYSFIFDLALKPKCAKSSCTSCSNVGEGNTLPVVLTNNFLRRTSVSEELSPSSYAFGENGVELDCPFGMNLVLWPLGDTVAEVSLRDNRVSGVLSDFSIDPSISLFKPIAEYNRTTPFLCDGRHSVDVAVTTLRANQYVYIPHQFSAAIKSTGGQEGSMFASCVVDGSNYNDVVERLASNDVQEAAHKLRMELMATSLDRKMALNPVEVSVKEYISRNQAINVVGSSSSESTAPASPVDAEAEMPPRSEDDKRRSRRKRRGGEYKQWQEQATWDSIIASRTIAPIANISVSSVERFRVEVAIGESVEFWRTHFIGQRAGLKMRLCSLRDAALLFNNIMFSDVDSAQWSFVSDEWLASSCVEREFASTDWLLSNSEGTVHFYVESLAPDTLYQFQVRRYVDSNSSVWSHWTPPFRTAPLEAPRASNATIGVRCLDRSPELSIRSTAIKDLDATRILSPALQLEVEWSKGTR